MYYAFDREQNVQPLSYRPGYPIFWSLDFNVNPMCSVIGQVVDGFAYVIEEIVLPDSNTFAACDAFLNRMQAWPLPTLQALWIYGDASGEHRQSSASRTDWQIVRECFARSYGFQISCRYSDRNPLVPDRVNCLNAALCNQLGNRRLLIDPGCRELIRDLDQVAWKEDAHGNSLKELDKSDPHRTHTSDALGYMAAQYFSMTSPGYRNFRIV